MKISVHGLGYVGSVTAACFAEKGHDVIGVEINPAKLAMFSRGETPIFEPGLAEILARVHRSGQLHVLGDARAAVRQSELSFICVGTPSQKSGHPDLTHIQQVADEIGGALRDKPTPHCVVVRSTMLPGTIAKVIVPCLEAAAGKQEGKDFHVVGNPEFMREGTAIKDFYEPPFVVIGERTPGAGDALAAAYSCIAAPQVRTTMQTAEAIKFACNAFHAVKITFANEVGQFCAANGINSREVMEVFCRDSRLNISAAYLRPGLPFGGSCLPKDLRALVGSAREAGIELPMLESVSRSNQSQILRTIELIADRGIREIGLLGLSFKTGTDDLRESPIVNMAEALLGKGCKLLIHDSEVQLTRLTGANKQFLDDKLPHIGSLLAGSLEQVIAASRLLIVCKKHPDYAALPSLISPAHQVIDLTGQFGAEMFPPHVYAGLYW